MELIKYIFSSPWVFIGIVILIYAAGEVIVTVINNILQTVIICKTKSINSYHGVHVERSKEPFQGAPSKQPKV